jgi:hypothetical protein
MKARLLLQFLLATTYATAYRLGDAVGILLRTSTSTSDAPPQKLEAYRHQMPRFGISTKTRFDISTLLQDANSDAVVDRVRNLIDSEDKIRLSISFDEGFHHIPWLDVYNKHSAKLLSDLTITFVYSGSDGSIHAVHRQSTMVDVNEHHKSFVVEYIWIEEANVDIRGGVLVLFSCVVLFVLVGMVGECSLADLRRNRGKDGVFLSTSSSEGFTKRL